MNQQAAPRWPVDLIRPNLYDHHQTVRRIDERHRVDTANAALALDLRGEVALPGQSLFVRRSRRPDDPFVRLGVSRNHFAVAIENQQDGLLRCRYPADFAVQPRQIDRGDEEIPELAVLIVNRTDQRKNWLPGNGAYADIAH